MTNWEYLEDKLKEIPLYDRDVFRAHMIGTFSVIFSRADETKKEWRDVIDRAVAFTIALSKGRGVA